MAITITDLTDTTWILNNTLISYAGGTYSMKNYNINITTSTAINDIVGSNSKTNFTSISIGYDSGGEQNCINLDYTTYPFYPFATGNDTKTLPDTWYSYYNEPFTITGGTDATNTALIAWLEANADQQIATPSVSDVSIIYESAEIATMSDTGTKTLKTGGKYMTDDVTIQYTKQGSSTVQSDWDETDATSAAYILNKPDVAEIEGIESVIIGKEDTYNSRFINWEESSGDITNLSVGSTNILSINKYDSTNDTWSTAGSIDLTENYLPLSGGTMTGNIYLDSSAHCIEQTLVDTANYGTAIRWNKETAYTETYKPSVGFYNQGAICILPYPTDSQPWSGHVGLFLNHNATEPYARWEDQYIGRFKSTPTSGKIPITDGTVGGMTSSDYSFTESTASVSLSFGGGTATITVRKKGNVVYFNPSIGNTSKFTSASSGDSLGTLPSGYRPSAELYMPIAMRTSGTWASATYYPCYLRIQTSGAMSIYGNTTNIRACTNIAGSVCFPV